MRRPFRSQADALGRAKKVERDGHKFDSKIEAARYGELSLLAKAGKISAIKVHPRFDLHAAGGKMVGTYVADFQYVKLGGEWVVEDVKPVGFMTPLSRWKIRHFEAEYGQQYRMVIHERKI